MKIVRLPRQLPSPEELGVPRLGVVSLLQDLTRELTGCQRDFMAHAPTNQGDAREFAALIQRTAAKLAEASAAWAVMAEATRSWDLK